MAHESELMTVVTACDMAELKRRVETSAMVHLGYGRLLATRKAFRR